MGIIEKKVRICKCERCGYEWIPRERFPIKCAKCNSPYWNKKRKNELQRKR